MEAQMVNRFEEALARMSDAEFLTMWEEIKQEGGEGPTVDEFIAGFGRSSDVISVSFNIDKISFIVAGDYNYGMAA